MKWLTHPLGQQRQVRAAGRPVDRRTGKPTPASASTGPALEGRDQRGAAARIDHRETSFSPAAFEAAWPLHHGQGAGDVRPSCRSRPSALSGKVTGLGVSIHRTRPAANFPTTCRCAGRSLTVFAIDPATGARRGDAAYSQDDRRQRPMGPVHRAARHAPTNSWWRPRATPRRTSTAAPSRASSSVVNLRPERLPRPTRRGRRW